MGAGISMQQFRFHGKQTSPFLLGTGYGFGGCSVGALNFNSLTENMRKGTSSKHFEILKYIHRSPTLVNGKGVLLDTRSLCLQQHPYCSRDKDRVDGDID
jgi:hypothetical protein